MKSDREQKVIASNRRASHDFTILNTYEAGIVLTGTEVKSLRTGRCSLQDTHCKFLNKNSLELYVYHLHINTYEHGNIQNHEVKRPRKLLLNHRELKKIKHLVLEKNIVLIPLTIYFSGHLVKIELALCTSKRKYDKRESQKEREIKRDLDRNFKFR